MSDKKYGLEDITKLMDKTYDLCYVDYRDNLEDRAKEIQECIHQGDIQPLEEELWEWIDDCSINSVCDIKKELQKEFQDEHDDLTEEEVDDLFNELDLDIQDEIYSRDESTPIKDLFRNTRGFAMFYDLGVDIDEPYDGDGVKRNVREIKKALHIKGHDYDELLDIMVEQASYGGRLVIYFYTDGYDLIKTKANSIQFTDPFIAVVDHWNGSGDHTQLEGFSINLPFKRESIFVDKAIKYNYTHEVCGMYDSWCDDTGFTLLDKKSRKKIKDSSLTAKEEYEAKMDKIYKDGGCTFGDMDMKRHRGVYYLNDFPCGWHCPKCHTFWID